MDEKYDENGEMIHFELPSNFPDDIQVDAYIPISVARTYFGDVSIRQKSGSMEAEQVQLHQIIVQVEDGKYVEAVAAGIERMLQQFHKKNDYAISVPLALLRQAKATKRTINTERIYPPLNGNRDDILSAAAPVLQDRPSRAAG